MNIIESRIIEDSLSPQGVRLSTFILTFPRSILAEFNTHRSKSSNAASSRAIPVHKLRARVKDEPFIPNWRVNQKGMQAGDQLDEESYHECDLIALDLRMQALEAVEKLDALGAHKQYANRYLEPWMYTTVLMSATDLNNLLNQRDHHAAEPSFHELASKMRIALAESNVRTIQEDGWHLPLLWSEDSDKNDQTAEQINDATYGRVMDYLKEFDECNNTRLAFSYHEARWEDRILQDICAGRCATVSYDNIETGKIDVLADIRRALQLSVSNPGHWSPFEHVATPATPYDMKYDLKQIEVVNGVAVPAQGEIGYCGNFRGWKQYRKFFINENIPG